MVKTLPEFKQKVCNNCGEMTGAYIVWKNSPICNDCAIELKLAEPKKQKKIPNEKNMLTKILENSQKELK